MTTTHYHVGANIPGYLPEGDTDTCSSKRAAIAAVADRARRFREDEWDLPASQRRTAHGSAKDGYVKFERPGDAYDLGIAIWWAACGNDDCATDEEE